MTVPMEPMLLSILYWPKKSLKSNLAAIRRCVMASASPALMLLSAFSTSDRMSPAETIDACARHGG